MKVLAVVLSSISFALIAACADSSTATAPPDAVTITGVRNDGTYTDGTHGIGIQGTITNDFTDHDVDCDTSVFVLIGDGTTTQPVGVDCGSSNVASGTTVRFFAEFAPPSAGKYQLRFWRVPSSGTAEYEFHEVRVK
jgi:hypothetical protein